MPTLPLADFINQLHAAHNEKLAALKRTSEQRIQAMDQSIKELREQKKLDDAKLAQLQAPASQS